MATEITPSKQVSVEKTPLSRLRATRNNGHFVQTNRVSQAASAIDSLKMESPVKKLDFGVSNKENMLDVAAFHALGKQVEDDRKTPTEVQKELDTTAVARDINSDECDEPLLQENSQRFVLFPIKYHEVCDA